MSARVFDEEAVLQHMRRQAPIRDLMAWLIETCADDAEAEDLLDVYLRVRDPEAGLGATVGEVRVYRTPPFLFHAPAVSVPAPPATGDRS